MDSSHSRTKQKVVAGDLCLKSILNADGHEEVEVDKS